MYVRTKMNRLLLVALVAISVGACKWMGDKRGTADNEKALARVFEDYLYLEDIAGLLNENNTTEDSAEIIRNYVDTWVRTHIVLNYAEKNPNIEQAEIQRRISEYRKALIGYYYEREIVLQKLDTIVQIEEVAQYFQKYKSNFELNKPIIRLRYVKVNNETPKLDSLRYWIKSDKELHIRSLEDYCFQYAINFSLDTMWYEYDKVTQSIPAKTPDPERFFQRKRYLEIADSTSLHLINILSFKAKGTISPLSYVYHDIRRIIINKRKLKLIDSTYDMLYKEGLRKKHFEIFI